MKNKSIKKSLALLSIVSVLFLSFSAVLADAPKTVSDPVNLGMAGNYAILAKSGISTVPKSVITGDIAVSPIGSTAITGFSLSKDIQKQPAGLQTLPKCLQATSADRP